MRDIRRGSLIVLLAAASALGLTCGVAADETESPPTEGTPPPASALALSTNEEAVSGQVAQPSLADDFDTATRLTLAGTMRYLMMPSPPIPVGIILSVQRADGGEEQWIIVGSDTRAMMRRGVRLGPRGPMQTGVSLTVTAYEAKPGSDVAQRLATEWRTPAPGITRFPLADAVDAGAKLAYGVEVTVPDGTTLVWGDRP